MSLGTSEGVAKIKNTLIFPYATQEKKNIWVPTMSQALTYPYTKTK